ncbi:proline dehydrogenase family protein [Exiguobacterium antarcticum]|uniref:proline dehydrogenase n=1 Tax=Exiguobacterium antarcticum TaxID=132920 RepID=A0ABT6R6C5_9BACL|nr:proline dehydrogenase family protein [Exiguobacterium antarcticum]AFS69579.1 Proline dehydrogenase [Exiguobacterium antarcticum B7]MDI3236477.1 proline dehydrogenase family protein [Exiguobacterium antarcticum]
MIEKITGPVFEYLAEDKRLIELARKVGLPLGGTFFVGGQTLDETVGTVQTLNQDGRAATIDCLGEFIESEKDAIDIADECIKVIHRISEDQLNAQISLKLTSVGLRLNPEIAFAQMTRILETAERFDMRVTINMEEEAVCESIIRVFERLRTRFSNVGIALQANLYRTRFDLERLQSTVRVVKGAYTGPADIYIERKETVDATYLQLVKQNLLQGCYTQVATHDEDMIQDIVEFVHQQGIGYDQFEFQMLQGMRPNRQKELVEEGFRVVIYVPHGVDWYTYLMKRLAERPANIVFTAISMLRL